MANSVATYLKYANLQMAAESLFGVSPTDPAGITKGAASMTPDELLTGNRRSSRVSTVSAQQLIDDGWTVVEHTSNTTTGFSGTLFKYTGETDPARGLVKDELVLSFRSTEFADDAARDNQETNKQEIKPYGWAFGQIDDMQTWFSGLQSQGLVTGPLSVTGYSLGGHLATAFNLLHQNDTVGGQPLIAATYTFNGAGVGDVTNRSLSQVMADFHSLRNGEAWTLFQTTTGLELYQQFEQILNGVPTTADLANAFATISNAAAGVPPEAANQPLRDDLALLMSAVKRETDLLVEANRVNAGIPDSSDGGAAKPVDAPNVAGIKLDYQLAVLGAARSTASYRTGPVDSGVDAYYGRNVGTVLPNFYDIYGGTSPSAVSNSQWHYGAATPIFIEDQPLLRGNVVELSIAQTLMYQDIKLLDPNFSQNDFGDTHSLVLLIDSLSIQNTLATLDPSVSQASLNAILQSASNARKQDGGSITGQGKAEGDVLENVLNSLSKMLQGSGATNTVANMDGGTWAKIVDRNTFYSNLQSLTISDAFKAMVGKVSISATAGNSSLPEQAKTDFAALLSLLTLSPIQIKATTDAATIEAKLGAAWTDAYAQWSADKNLSAAQRNAGQANYTDTYLNDRHTLLQWQMVRNLTNATTGDPLIDRTASEIVNYDDNATGTRIQLAPAAPAPSGSYPTRYVTFGSNANENNISGAAAADRLYGGGGADTLNGQAGADYLEGNVGSDALNGGEGDDIVQGGTGSDLVYAMAGDDIVDAGELGGGSRWLLLRTHGNREPLVRVNSSQAANGQRFVVVA